MVDEHRKDIDLKTMDEKNISTNFLSTKTDFSSIWQRKAIIKKSLVVHLELTTIHHNNSALTFQREKVFEIFRNNGQHHALSQCITQTRLELPFAYQWHQGLQFSKRKQLWIAKAGNKSIHRDIKH